MSSLIEELHTNRLVNKMLNEIDSIFSKESNCIVEKEKTKSTTVKSDDKDFIHCGFNFAGFDKSEISLQLKENILEVSAEMKSTNKLYDKIEKYDHIKKSSKYINNIELYDLDKITSEYFNGFLYVKIPKLQSKTIKINIQ